MSSEASRIDITDDPALRRLAHAVRSTNASVFLREGGKDLAEVRPVGGTRTATRQRRKVRLAPTPEDREAFLSSFGAWHGLVDVDRLKRDLDASRKLSRPAPRL